MKLNPVALFFWFGVGLLAALEWGAVGVAVVFIIAAIVSALTNG